MDTIAAARAGRRECAAAITGDLSAAFGAGSVLAAYPVNAEMLIATRALLGIAGATLMTSSLSMAAGIFRDLGQRTVAIGIVIVIVTGGAAIGPLIGGWLLQHFWWGAVFLVAAPVTALFLVLGPLLLPERREAAPPGGGPPQRGPVPRRRAGR